MQTVTYTLPEFWLCALINDDYSGLTDEEQAQIETFFSDTGLGSPLCDYTPRGFMTHHDARPYGVLACDCCDIVFQAV